MKKMISAGILPFYYANATREYLLLLYHAGHWDFPKGKLETSESKHDAAIRELKEETGLSTSIFSEFEHSFSYYLKDYCNNERAYKTVYFYLGKANTKNVTLSHEHQNYLWLPYAQAREKLTYDNAKTLLDKANMFLEKNRK